MTRQKLERITLVCATFALGIFLLRGAHVDRQDELRRSLVLLDEISSIDALMDAELLRVAYGIRTNYDTLTQLQSSLRGKFELLSADGFVHHPLPSQAIEVKLRLSEDFKTEFSIHRNSVTIANALMQSAIRDANHAHQDDLYHLEAAIWRFISKVNAPTAAELDQQLERLRANSSKSSADSLRLSSIESHIRMLLQKDSMINELVESYFQVPLEPEILSLNLALRQDFDKAVEQAVLYGVGLFCLTLTLLGYGTRKAYLAHRYVSLLKDLNAELEARVAERTAELQEANQSLAREMEERSEMEARLRMAQKLESIGQLAAGVAHEINTPCQYVSDNLNFVEDSWANLAPLFNACHAASQDAAEQLPSSVITSLWRDADGDFLLSELASAISESKEGMKQIRDTVQALKEFSHPDSDAMLPADINHLIQNALMVSRNEYKYVANVELVLADPAPVAPCYSSLISQVLLNLIVNAAHAIEEKNNSLPGATGCITVSSVADADHVIVSVTDDGPGIPEAIREKVFDPFFTTKPIGKGSGQGLAIAHKVITQHGGRFELDTKLGVGTTFSIHLPLHPVAIQAAPQLSHA